MAKIRLHHHAIIVNDLDETLKVFCEHLGMKLVGRMEGVGENLEIAFVEEPRTGHRIEFLRRTKDFGKLDHIAYKVDDVDKAFDEFRKKEGFEVDKAPFNIDKFKVRMAFLKDRNGLRIQFVEYY